MSENKKLELLDQYDDVTFALLMDEYAEEEGARLRKEFEEAQAAGEVSDTSDALDEKCLQMIHRDFAKKRGKENVRKIIRITSKVAVAVMVFLGVATATIFSVDAFKIPVLNFIFEQQNKYFTIGSNVSDTSPEDTILKLLPDGYSVVLTEEKDDKSTYAYQNNNGSFLMYERIALTDDYRYDVEETNSKEFILCGYNAMIIEKNGLRLIWVDNKSAVVHSLYSTDLGEEQLIAIANGIIGLP